MKTVVKVVQRIQLALGTLFLSIFLVAVLIQIITRYVGIPVIWTDDVAMYSFAWSVFMGGGAMILPHRHFAFTFLAEKLHGPRRHLLGIVIAVFMMVFTVAMFFYGMQAVRVFWNHRWISISTMKMGYTWMCVPITGATGTLYLISHILDEISALRRKAVA